MGRKGTKRQFWADLVSFGLFCFDLKIRGRIRSGGFEDERFRI
jgi:hypothetical protein